MHQLKTGSTLSDSSIETNYFLGSIRIHFKQSKISYGIFMQIFAHNIPMECEYLTDCIHKMLSIDCLNG